MVNNSTIITKTNISHLKLRNIKMKTTNGVVNAGPGLGYAYM
jgi:hypothetical protein